VVLGILTRCFAAGDAVWWRNPKWTDSICGSTSLSPERSLSRRLDLLWRAVRPLGDATSSCKQCGMSDKAHHHPFCMTRQAMSPRVGVRSTMRGHSGTVSGPQSWSTMKIANNCAGAVALAFSAKMWSAPGGSNHV
jgi:hypothetical protein